MLRGKTVRKCLTAVIFATFLVFTSFAPVFAASIYSQDTYSNGTYLYSNNPEAITDKDLGDSTISGANHILYSAQASGYVQAVMEHLNNTSYSNIYLGMQLYNPTSSNLTITLSNIGGTTQYGGSASWYGFEPWDDFFSGINTSKYHCSTSYTISPHGVVWLFGNNIPPVPKGSPACNAVRFYSSGTVSVNFYAYTNINNINGYATPEYYNQNDSANNKVYKGTAVYPDLWGTFNWNITSPNPTTLQSWTTNTKTSTAGDMLSFTVPTGPNSYVIASPTSPAPLNNLANWGVLYYETYHITNTSGSTRTVNLGLSSTTGAHVAVQVTIDGSTSIHNLNLGSATQSYGTVSVPNNSSKTVTARLVLTLPSNGTVTHNITD
jgi:hypothetical protein